MLTMPNLSLTAEHWKGDNEAHIEQKEANPWQTLANFHKGSGMSNAWILLTDTLAGAVYSGNYRHAAVEPPAWAPSSGSRTDRHNPHGFKHSDA